MNNFTTNITEFLLNNLGPTLDSVLKECVRSLLEEAFNQLMKIELTSFLDYEPYERSDNEDSRNGFSEKSFATSFGNICLKIPRDRLNLFKSALTPKYSRHDTTTEDTILKLFRSGLSNSEITEIIEAIYSKKYSSSTISNITKKVTDNIEAFKNRPLKKHYAVVYMDATFTPVRRDTVEKEGLSIAIGITPDGYKEVLGYILSPNESAVIYKELLDSFKIRGVENVDLIVTDGLSGIVDTISEIYPNAKIQRCLVHVQRNIMAKVRVKDRKEITEDFKKVYQSENKDIAKTELDYFKEKWRKNYKNVVHNIENCEAHLLTFYDFPSSIRHSIYSTNIIEGFNKQIKRMTKHKEQFPDPESLERFIVSLFNDYNEKFLTRVHKGFAETSSFWITNES